MPGDERRAFVFLESMTTPDVREDGPVPLKLTRNAFLNGSLVGPPLIVSVSVDTARDLIAKGYAEAVPGNTEKFLPELREQPKREPIAHTDSPTVVTPKKPAPAKKR